MLGTNPAPSPTRSRLALTLPQTLALLALEAACVVLFILQIAYRTKLPGYVTDNDLSARLRRHWLNWVAAGSVAALVTGFVAATKGKQKARATALALVLSPAVPLCFLPSLLTVYAWTDRELSFLLTTAATVLAITPLLRISNRAFSELRPPPALPGYLALALSTLRERRVIARVVVLAAAGAVALYFAIYTIRVHHKVQTSLLDLGLFDNLFWNARHGVPFYAASATWRGQSYLAIHAELLLYLLLPLYALAPRPETLLVIQAALVVGAVIPFYLIAEKRIGHVAACALSIAYLSYPPMHRPIFYDFHFLTLASFFILWAALFLERRHWIRFWIFAALSMMCREDVALGLVGIGLGLALSSYRPRTGWALAAIAALYVLIVKFEVMTHFGAASFVQLYTALLPVGDHTFGGVIKTIVSNPIFTLNSLWTPSKLAFVLQILLPLSFVCVRVPRFWFLLFPGIFITLLSNGYPAIVQIEFQYATHFVPYVFLGSVGFFYTYRPGGRLDTASLATLLLATAIMTVQFGAFQQSNFYSGFKKIDFTWTAEDAERLHDLREIAGLIPPDASLSASEAEGAHLGARRELFPLKERLEDADYILFSPVRLGIGRDIPLVRGALTDGTYGVAAKKGQFVLLRRGAPAGDNAALLGELPGAP